MAVYMRRCRRLNLSFLGAFLVMCFSGRQTNACQFFQDKEQSLNWFSSIPFQRSSGVIPRPSSTGFNQEKKKKHLLSSEEREARISALIRDTPFRNKRDLLDLINGSPRLGELYFAIFSSNTPVSSVSKLDRIIKTLILETITRYHNDQNNMYPLRIISSHEGNRAYSFIVISQCKEDLKECIMGLCERLCQKAFIFGGHGQVFLYEKDGFVDRRQSAAMSTSSRTQDLGMDPLLAKENLEGNFGDGYEEKIDSGCSSCAPQSKWSKTVPLVCSAPENQSELSETGFYIALYKKDLPEKKEIIENEEDIDEEEGAEESFFLCFESAISSSSEVLDSLHGTLPTCVFDLTVGS